MLPVTDHDLIVLIQMVVEICIKHEQRMEAQHLEQPIDDLMGIVFRKQIIV